MVIGVIVLWNISIVDKKVGDGALLKFMVFEVVQV
jgi:hypothetical protein